MLAKILLPSQLPPLCLLPTLANAILAISATNSHIKLLSPAVQAAASTTEYPTPSNLGCR